MPGQFSAISERLRSLTAGAVQAVKDTTVCLAKVGAAGDFGDWYEIINKKDLCTGEEISTTGRLISAAGLFIGRSKAWRAIADQVGFAVNTKRIFSEADEILDVVRKTGADEAFIRETKEILTDEMRTVVGRTAKEKDFLSRVVELSDDTLESGKFRIKEGVGAARYELKSGKKLSNSKEIGVDFVDSGTGEKLSLKGPLKKDNMESLPQHAMNVEAFAKNATKPSSAVAKVIVDLFGLSESDKKIVKDIIEKSNPSKPFEFLE